MLYYDDFLQFKGLKKKKKKKKKNRKNEVFDDRFPVEKWRNGDSDFRSVLCSLFPRQPYRFFYLSILPRVDVS